MKVTQTLALIPAVFLSACGGGGSPSTPTDPGSSPAPGHSVNGLVFYDENANGILDAGEVVRLPGTSVNVGGRTAQAGDGGRFTATGVPAGTQSAQALASGLPAYYTAGAPVAVDVPQITGSEVAVPAVLDIGSNRPNYYLAIGDSITSGVGGGPGVDYPAFLAADLRAYWGEASVINAGDPGTKSNQGEPRTGPAVARHRPAYTLILYGTNDWNDGACRSAFPCYTIDALRSMILQARDGGSNPILGTIPPANPAFEDKNASERNVWIEDMNVLLRAMADQEDVPVAEIHGDFMAQPNLESLFADHVHPNEAGYLLMTRSWFDAITNAAGGGSSRRSFGFSRPSGS